MTAAPRSPSTAVALQPTWHLRPWCATRRCAAAALDRGMAWGKCGEERGAGAEGHCLADEYRGQGWNAGMSGEMCTTQRTFPYPQSFTSPNPTPLTPHTTGQQQRGRLCIWYSDVGDVHHTTPLPPPAKPHLDPPPHTTPLRNRSTAVWTFMHSAS